MALIFTSSKLVKYWTGSAWAESKEFGGAIKLWNGSQWRIVQIRPYANIASETQTVTVGSIVFKGIAEYGFQLGGYGSISDGTFELTNNATIEKLSWGNLLGALNFTLAGNFPNSGWDNVVINGITFNRSAATYSYDGDNNLTSWSIVGENPFGTTNGVIRPAVFTP